MARQCKQGKPQTKKGRKPSPGGASKRAETLNRTAAKTGTQSKKYRSGDLGHRTAHHKFDRALLECISDPTPNQLRCYADEFRALAKKFQTPSHGQREQSLAALRWNLCLGWGVQAARLLCCCLDHNAFSGYAYSLDYVPWDKRQTTAAEASIVSLLTEMAISEQPLPLAMFSTDEECKWAIERTPEIWWSETDPVCDLTDKELTDWLRGIVDEPSRRSEEHEKTRRVHIMLLLSWYAAIRWWLAPGYSARFRGDWKKVFHPWAERFSFPPPVGLDTRDKLPEFASDPSVPAEDAARLLLEAHAEVQAQACLLLGDILDAEATSFENETRPSLTRLLGSARDALTAVDRGLSELLTSARAGTVDPSGVGELSARLQTEWIPLFRKSTLGCEQQLATVLQAAGRSDICVHDLIRCLDVCVNSIWLGAESDPDGLDPLERMGRPFVNAPSDARVLIDALNNALDAFDADQPGAESGAHEPTSTAEDGREVSGTPAVAHQEDTGSRSQRCLNDMERNIVDAIRERGRMKTGPLARAAGYAVSSTFKQCLAAMVRNCILESSKSRTSPGYALHPDFQKGVADNSPDFSAPTGIVRAKVSNSPD